MTRLTMLRFLGLGSSGSRLFSFAVAIVLAAVARAAGAQGAPEVVEIVVMQEGVRVSEPTLIGLIETRVGTPVALDAVRESILHLMSLGRFDDVQVFEEPARGGVRVRYELLPSHPIDRVELRGSLGLSEADVKRAVTERYGTAPAAGRVPELQRAMLAFYRSHGFTAARIVPRIETTHTPDRASLVLDVEAGARARLSVLEIEGLAGGERASLLAEIGVRAGSAYDADVIQAGLDRYERDLRAKGFYQARAVHSVRFDSTDSARVTVIVDRGPIVSVTFEGDPLPEADRDRLVPIRTEASVDEDLLEDSSRAIEEYLRGRGYRDAAATYVRMTDGDRLRVVFRVSSGRRYLVAGVDVGGQLTLPVADVLAALAVRSETPFVQETVDTGVRAVRSLYRSRGFTRPDIRAETTTGTAPEQDTVRSISVLLTIAEGPRTVVDRVAFDGVQVLGEEQLRRTVTMAAGRPFVDAELASDRERLDVEYRNRGYDSVVITPTVTLTNEDTRALVTFRVTEGARAVVDRVIIVGNRRTKTSTIERELAVRPGEPLGSAALVESQQRLAALGLFRRIQILPVVHPGESRRDVLVQLEEAPPTTLGYGGGVESSLRLRPTGEGGQAEERFEVAPRGFFEVGRRNLWGKNRAVNLFGRVSLRSRDVVAPGTAVVQPGQGGYGFNEYRLYATFREPKVGGTAADLLVTGIVNQAVRSSFNFITRETRAEAGARLSPRLSIAGRYSFEQTRLFDEHISPEEQPLIDRLFPQVRLSGFSGSLIRDSRDDGLYPNRGTLTVLDGEIAARVLGSEVGFIKTFIQTSAYLPLPTSRRVIVALSARLGAARGFRRLVPLLDEQGQPVVAERGPASQQTVQDLPASKRFFAGGDTTVRGFSLDRLGDAKTISPTGFPTGGNGEIILNSELRVGVLRQRAEVVGFLDAGNVFQRVSDLDVTNLRAAAGVGLRFRSPVGPIRADLGFNLKRRELVPGQLERAYVLHVSLGQAF